MGTDSFLKDDSVETRKITLTPNLLRDDSSTSTRTSNDSKELKQRPSLDKLEKDSPDKSKDKKDKKDKKAKSSVEDEVDELMAGKRSTDNQRASPSPSKDSEETAAVEEPVVAQTPERQPSKLQKQ